MDGRRKSYGEARPIFNDWRYKYQELNNLELEFPKCIQRVSLTITKGNCLMWLHSRNYHRSILLREAYPERTYNLFILSLQRSTYLDKIIFMQYGISLHIALRVQQLLRQKFITEGVICRCFPIAWPSQSMRFFALGLPTSRGCPRAGYVERTIMYHELQGAFLQKCYFLLLGNAVDGMKYIVQKNGAQNEPELNVLNEK